MPSILGRVTPLLAASCFLLHPAACGRDTDRVAVDPDRLTSAARRPAEAAGDRVIRFGFDPRLDPVEEARTYWPLLVYLQKKTGFPFEIRFTKKNENIIDNLGRGVVQFAALGSVSHVKAREVYGAVTLVRGLNPEKQAHYRAAIVTRRIGPLSTLGEIRGRTFAFGDENSTQGHLIPRIMLLNAGLGLKDLKRFFFAGSHLKCAEAVIGGQADAGGMQDTLALELAGKGDLRILATSRPYPSSGISAGPSVTVAVREAVRQALLAFEPRGKDAGGLYHWEKTEMPLGFIRSNESDYDSIRAAMLRLGLLQPKPRTP